MKRDTSLSMTLGENTGIKLSTCFSDKVLLIARGDVLFIARRLGVQMRIPSNKPTAERVKQNLLSKKDLNIDMVLESNISKLYRRGFVALIT